MFRFTCTFVWTVKTSFFLISYAHQYNRRDHRIALFSEIFVKALTHKIVLSGAPQGLEGVSVDYALPKAQAALPDLNLSPGSVGGGGVALRMRYSHLGCNVVHEDVAFTEVIDAHDTYLFQ